MRSVTAIALAYLAASPLFACASDPPLPAASDPTTPTATTTTPTSALGGTCASAKDCDPGLMCVLPFNGARIMPGPGSCRPENEPQMGGRPLYVDGAARVSSSARHRDWVEQTNTIEIDGAWKARLERAAFEEHASIAAFARTICQLVALGAPAWLVQKTQAALADEIRHATRTFAWLGGAIGPGPLPEAVAPFTSGDLAADLARDVFRGGCIGEALAAHEAAELAEKAPLGELRAYYTDIAEDEARHAALAYETAAWLSSRFPSAKAELDAAVGAFRASPDARLAPLMDAVFAA